MRAVVLSLIGVLAACGSAQALDGQYQGNGSDPSGYKWKLHAKITPAEAGAYKVQVTSTNATCASQTEGVGTLRGNVLKTVGTCPLTIRFNGRTARVIEGEGCAAEHGSTCTYSGTLRVER